MARILLEQGEEISSLVLLDSLAPSIMQVKGADDEATELFELCVTLGKLYGTDLKIDLERLRQSSGEGNAQYIINLLNDRGLEINSEQFEAFYRVYRANLHCYLTYKPSILSRNIDVSLYRATQENRGPAVTPPDYGWNQLLPSPVRIYDVEANHFSILDKVDIFRKIAESPVK